MATAISLSPPRSVCLSSLCERIKRRESYAHHTWAPSAPAPTEQAICHLWDTQGFQRQNLASLDGTTIECVYRGRRRGGGGPDFVEAAVAFDGELRHGDVEVHVKSADWFAHRHHLAHAYDDVILHVVLHHSGRAARKANGTVVPTLVLSGRLPNLAEPYEQSQWCQSPLEPEPCQSLLQRRGPAYLAAMLDHAGQQRLEARVASREGEIAAVGAQEALYRALLEAMGYSANRRPFRLLAAALPWSHLEGFLLARPPAERLFAAEALLFGVASRLPGQRGRSHLLNGRDAHYADQLEEIWDHYRPGWEGADCGLYWHTTGARPTNHPARRIAAAAHYLARVADGGLSARLESLGRHVPADRLSSALSQHYLGAAIADDYWAWRFDFGFALRSEHPRLVGTGRAADIVVNVALPYLIAASDLGLTDCSSVVREAYRLHRPLAHNEITRLMSALVGDGRPLPIKLTAQRQQGMLHIYRLYCREQRCGECLLGA